MCIRLLYAHFWFYFFFFKQKTAYEMRISDWSSDVCSSDLALRVYAGLDRPSLDGHLVLREGERMTRSDPQLLLDEVEAGDQLGDGVLHLQSGVDRKSTRLNSSH